MSIEKLLHERAARSLDLCDEHKRLLDQPRRRAVRCIGDHAYWFLARAKVPQEQPSR
jgi:hypothetical protein